MIIFLLLAAWIATGTYFGWKKAKMRYHETMSKYPTLMQTEAAPIKREALMDGFLELFKWSALGIITVLAYFVSLCLIIIIRSDAHKDPRPVNAAFWALVITVLATLSLGMWEEE